MVEIFFDEQNMALPEFQKTFPAQTFLVAFLDKGLLFKCKGYASALTIGYIPNTTFKGFFASRTNFLIVFTHGC
jgi:hypothetical protein